MSEMADPPTRRQRTAAGCLALCLLSCGLTALAAPLPPLAPATSSGDYTVTPQGCRDSYAGQVCMAQWVEERVEPDGAFTLSTTTFTNKPNGAYSYRTGDMYCDAYFYACQTQYSGSIAVVVGDNIPEPEPLETQLQYRFRARLGNVVGDAKPDILVERIAGGQSGDGVIDAVILRQDAGRQFTPIVPSAAQRASSVWAPANLGVAVEDIDVDGFADVTVTDIADSIPGADNQIVYSPGRPLSSTPKSVRSVDAELTEFTANVLDYVIDRDYYADNAPLTITEQTVWRIECPYVNYYSVDIYYGFPSGSCYTLATTIYVALPDYSGFSQDAVAIWQFEEALDIQALTRTEVVDRIKSAVERQLGVPIGGWDMGGIFGSPGSTEDIDARRGLEAFLGILGVATANADEVDPDAAPNQTLRDADRVYIVGRYVFGEGTSRLHTALYYQIPNILVPSWISAFDSDKRTLFDGTLVAETNDPRDTPLLMKFTLGSVTPPSPTSPYSYFFGDLLSAHARYRALPDSQKAPYDAIPELPPCPWCKGRNSNGYVNGIIQYTKGAPNIDPGSIYYDLSKLVGWEYPVEASYFAP